MYLHQRKSWFHHPGNFRTRLKVDEVKQQVGFFRWPRFFNTCAIFLVQKMLSTSTRCFKNILRCQALYFDEKP